MKILRIQVQGLLLYKDFDISLYALQRVQNNHLDQVYNLFGNIYTNNVNAFVGINASGKTTALNVISFCYCLLNGMPLNGIQKSNILQDGVETIFDIDFYAENKIYHLNTKLIRNIDDHVKYNIKICYEALQSKAITTKINKSNLLNFTGIKPIKVRDESDKTNTTFEYLLDDVSIMIAVKKTFENKTIFYDFSPTTNFDLFLSMDIVYPEIIKLLDTSIEYLKFEVINGKKEVRLKFYNQDEILIHDPKNEIYSYLSSGTIKSLSIFHAAIPVLKNGGYLLIDEIETHFNRELVATLIRLFLDRRINSKGAVLIFSTHYPDLLDELERNDAVFITRKQRQLGGLQVDNLSTLLNRNDMSKSDVYKSGYLGTAPKYSAIQAVKNISEEYRM